MLIAKDAVSFRCSAERKRFSVIHITDTTVFDEREIQERVVRAAGSVNEAVREASAAIELRLDLEQSSLPPDVKLRLIAVGRRHVTAEGIFVVVSRSHRSQTTNRDTALAQLLRFLIRASVVPPEGGPDVVKRHRGATPGQEKVPTGHEESAARFFTRGGEGRLNSHARSPLERRGVSGRSRIEKRTVPARRKPGRMSRCAVR